MKIELSPQVVEFIRNQAPQPRRALRVALRALEREQGDIKALEGELRGFCRLRVRDYRIVFQYHGRGRLRSIRCIYAERRSIIYEVFERMVSEHMRSDED